MRRPYGVLSVVLLVLGVAVAAGGVAVLESSSKADVNAELGKWLLTVAAGLVVTGALSAVVKEIDERRSERVVWHSVLNDLVGANQIVTVARLRLLAHHSAKTYHEQLAELMGARVVLRRIRAMGIVVADPSLRDLISAMQDYLDKLGHEYEKGYLWVSRQQRLDAVWLTAQMDFAKSAEAPPLVPAALAGSPPAWLLLRRKARFPRLARLLDEQVFKIDAFRGNYKLAKGRLETHAGFRQRTADAAINSASKLLERTSELVNSHLKITPELQTSISAGVAALEQARNRKDRGAIDTATLELNMATAEAIDTVFVATEDSAAPPYDLAILPEDVNGDMPPAFRGVWARMATLRSLVTAPRRAKSS